MDKNKHIVSFSVDAKTRQLISDSADVDAETIAAFCRRAVLARIGKVTL